MRMLVQTKSKDFSGFTLIELIVVIALMAMITVLAVPGMSSYFKVSLSTATTQMASIVKEAYNSAVVTGKVHRVVYDFEKSQYWVEVGPKTLLLETEQSLKEAQKSGRKRDDKAEKKSEFSLERKITRKKQSLPFGVSFEDIKTDQSPDKLTEGFAYTHIFPHGIAERTVIHLKDNGKHQVTLYITALSGRTRLIDGYLEEKQITE